MNADEDDFSPHVKLTTVLCKKKKDHKKIYIHAINQWLCLRIAKQTYNVAIQILHRYSKLFIINVKQYEMTFDLN